MAVSSSVRYRKYGPIRDVDLRHKKLHELALALSLSSSPPDMSNSKTKLRFVMAVPVLLFFLGFGIETGKVAPKHAIVRIDVDSGTYFAPPCLSPYRT